MRRTLWQAFGDFLRKVKHSFCCIFYTDMTDIKTGENVLVFGGKYFQTKYEPNRISASRPLKSCEMRNDDWFMHRMASRAKLFACASVRCAVKRTTRAQKKNWLQFNDVLCDHVLSVLHTLLNRRA